MSLFRYTNAEVAISKGSTSLHGGARSDPVQSSNEKVKVSTCVNFLKKRLDQGERHPLDIALKVGTPLNLNS